MTVFQILIYSIIISLFLTSIGFRKTVWFISIGYTLAIAACSVFVLLFSDIPLDIFNYLQFILLIIWGFRLGYFILKRESDTNYNSSVTEETGRSQELPLIARFGIWLSVSLLYVCMFSPAVFAIQEGIQASIFTIAGSCFGLFLMGSGVILEAVADSQKSAFKRLYPKGYCNTGLYKWVRFPNYFGEILVWTGNFFCAIAFYSSWWQWITAAIGLICIILIMMGSAKRLEKKQSKNYGKDPAFQEYEKSIPVLFPWIRLYSLQKIKVYLE